MIHFDDYLRINNINITSQKMTLKVKGFVYYDNEEFHIIINDRLGTEQSLLTLKHELLHIALGHFDSELTREEIETDIQDKIKEYEFNFI